MLDWLNSSVLNLKQKRLQAKLIEGIEAQDDMKIDAVLGAGLKKIHYTLYREEQFAGKIEKIPAQVFDDPMKLAQFHRVNEKCMAVFKKHGWDVPEIKSNSIKHP